jgi:hypothetical protein
MLDALACPSEDGRPLRARPLDRPRTALAIDERAHEQTICPQPGRHSSVGHVAAPVPSQTSGLQCLLLPPLPFPQLRDRLDILSVRAIRPAPDPREGILGLVGRTHELRHPVPSGRIRGSSDTILTEPGILPTRTQTRSRSANSTRKALDPATSKVSLRVTEETGKGAAEAGLPLNAWVRSADRVERAH